MRFEKERYMPWIMVSPSLIIVFALTLFPLFYSIYLSTRSYDLTALWKDAFIGFENYSHALNEDAYLAEALLATFKFAAGSLLVQIPLGLAIALLLNREFRGRRLVRTIITLPLVAAPIAIGLVWKYMYDMKFGIIPYFFQIVFGSSPHWLAESTMALVSIIIYDSWQWAPFVALILVAGLQGLPQEPFESATIYGASAVQRFRYLTLPMIRPLLVIVALLRLIDLLKLWDPVWALTRGGPGIATQVVSWYLYRMGFLYLWVGYTASIALMFLYLVIILSVIALRRIARL